MTRDDNPYQSPKADLEPATDFVRDVSKGRRAYVFQLFLIWFVPPLLASVLARAIGLDEGGLTTTVSGANAETQFQSAHLDMLYVWYLSFPLFVWVTYRRLQDTSLSPWLTPLFLLPLVNLVIWFWPPARR